MEDFEINRHKHKRVCESALALMRELYLVCEPTQAEQIFDNITQALGPEIRSYMMSGLLTGSFQSESTTQTLHIQGIFPGRSLNRGVDIIKGRLAVYKITKNIEQATQIIDAVLRGQDQAISVNSHKDMVQLMQDLSEAGYAWQ